MRYHALACDYDGTLASHGRVDAATIAAVQQLRRSGRKLILVTGRIMEELAEVFPEHDFFDAIVAENGALLFHPSRRERRILAEAPPPQFVEALRARQVSPLLTGEVIVATSQPNETTVLNAIRDLGLELHVIFNKGSVMVLPSSVNKATGLRAALDELGLSAHNVVGIGDAENDQAFLKLCECGVAVANALPSVKEQADWVTEHDHGAGVIELVEHLLRDDLGSLAGRLGRRQLPIGERLDGQGLRVDPFGITVLVVGPSGSGKSLFVTGLLEQLSECAYQFCVVDPEGDYNHLANAVVLGSSQRAPTVEEVMTVLERVQENCVVNLLGLALDERPRFFDALLPALLRLRTTTGRPHWLIIDEAHHLFPARWTPGQQIGAHELHATVLVTVHPEHVAHPVLDSADAVVVIGNAPEAALKGFARTSGDRVPSPPPAVESGAALFWARRPPADPVWFRAVTPRAERRRHRRKYAEGELPPARSFYFRGPEGKLNLRAHNLALFVQMADGVDDDTWTYHLRQGDYAQWFREAIKDERLVRAAQEIAEQDLSPSESRGRIKAVIEEHYTAPE